MVTGSGEPRDATVLGKRIGHTAAVIGDQISIFGGCGGKGHDSTGRRWACMVFDAKTYTKDPFGSVTRVVDYGGKQDAGGVHIPAMDLPISQNQPSYPSSTFTEMEF